MFARSSSAADRTPPNPSTSVTCTEADGMAITYVMTGKAAGPDRCMRLNWPLCKSRLPFEDVTNAGHLGAAAGEGHRAERR